MKEVKETNFSHSHDETYQQAIVIGGSVAGLMAARVLSEQFANVTVLERDSYPQNLDFRKGTPHTRHPHIILKRGLMLMEQNFPGLSEALMADGAVEINFGQDIKWYGAGGWRPHFESNINTLGCSRPLLESHLRRMLVNNHQNVQILEQCDVIGLLAQNGQVNGVKMRQTAVDGKVTETILAANLVVDASGRSSKAPLWLEALGFEAPQETTINAFPSYTTCIYERPANFQAGWKSIYVQQFAPTNRRGAIITPLEGGERWHVSMIGMAGEHAPNDAAGFMEWAKSLPESDVYEALKDATPVTPIWGYRRAENRLRHFDQMPAFLDGFVAMGDAVYALNPVYGQGMSVASIAAMLLGQCVVEQKQKAADLRGLAEYFQKQLVQVISFPWHLATGEDLRWETTEGPRPELDQETMLMNNYMGQVMMASMRNTNILEAFYHVMHMVEAPTIFFRPDIVLQVAAEMGAMMATV